MNWLFFLLGFISSWACVILALAWAADRRRLERRIQELREEKMLQALCGDRSPAPAEWAQGRAQAQAAPVLGPMFVLPNRMPLLRVWLSRNYVREICPN